MKKILFITLLTTLLFSCGKKEENGNIDSLIASKNLVSIKAKRAELQAELTKLDDAIAVLDIKKSTEALVSVSVVKDTVFSHYLEIQGSVNTKENLIIYPQFSGILNTLNIKGISSGAIYIWNTLFTCTNIREQCQAQWRINIFHAN